MYSKFSVIAIFYAKSLETFSLPSVGLDLNKLFAIKACIAFYQVRDLLSHARFFIVLSKVYMDKFVLISL